MTNILTIQTPLGAMTLVERGGALAELRLKAYAKDDEHEQETPLLRQAVWSALLDIPYGHTLSYGDIAKAIGKPKASRAVGMANNRNPLPIFIPCHRVIGADGKMVGYGGGLDVKDYLLKLETP